MTKKMSLPDTALENLADAAGIFDYTDISDVRTTNQQHSDIVLLDVTVTVEVTQAQLRGMLK